MQNLTKIISRSQTENVSTTSFKYENNKLYVIIMPRTSFRVNPQSILCLNVKELLVNLSVCLRTKWLWVQTTLLSLNENINSSPFTIESLHKSALR